MARATKLEWLPLILVAGLGYSSTPILPIWLATAIERFQLTPLQGSLLASLELGCIAFASIAAATRLHASRLPLVLAVALSVAGNLASFLATGPLVLAVARAVVGLSCGVALAEITRYAARAPNPHRVFSLQQLGLIAFAAAFFSSIVKAIAWAGPGAPFLYAQALGVLALVSLVWLPSPGGVPSANVAASPSDGGHSEALPRASAGGGWLSAAVVMSFAAIVLFSSAQSSHWANIGAAAKNSGVSLEMLSQALAIGALLNFLAPVASGAMGLRWGRAVPLVLGCGGFGLSCLLIGGNVGPMWFAAGAIGLNLFLLFLVPFLLSILAGLDASGRGAAAGPAFMMIGAAIGPAAGGLVLSAAGFATLGVVGAAASGCALMLALAAAARGRNPVRSSRPASLSQR